MSTASAQDMWAILVKALKKDFEQKLGRYRPNLAKATGVLPGKYLPTTGNTGSGYTPIAHAASHKNGGADEIATATAASNAIPKADSGGKLAIGWIPTIPISTGTSGTLSADRGGTGQSSYAIGDILYASGATALSKLADVATGNALLSGGVGTAPSWGKIGLTTHVSGVLGGTNGGTGVNNGSFLLTVPATGTAALLGTANVFTAIQTVNNNFFCDKFYAGIGAGGTGSGVCDIRASAASQPQLTIFDTQDYDSSPYGRIMFGTKYNSSGTYTTGPFIDGLKENATSGNFAYALAFGTRPNGGSSTERGRFTAPGAFWVGLTTGGLGGAGDGEFAGDVKATHFRVGGNQVIGARITGWGAATGTPTRTTFATSTVTTTQLAERVKALIDDLIAHGLIGP